MNKKLALFFFLIITFGITQIAGSTEFDELDKPPEGAHEGQTLLGLYFSMGLPYSDYIDAENDFLIGSTYGFDNEITKAIEVSHVSYSIGLSYEYMPIDHIGVTAKLNRTYLVQNTTFGPEYENWKSYLYRDVTYLLGPSIHATNRKRWDFILTPVVGYSFSKYVATPIAKKIISNYSGSTRRKSQGFAYGTELTCTIYFTGGLYISIGGEWLRKEIDLGDKFDLTNPQTLSKYTADTSGQIDTYSIIVGAGYTFLN